MAYETSYLLPVTTYLFSDPLLVAFTIYFSTDKFILPPQIMKFVFSVFVSVALNKFPWAGAMK